MLTINFPSLSRPINKPLPQAQKQNPAPAQNAYPATIKEPLRFGGPSRSSSSFTKKELLFATLYLLGSFAGISKFLTGNWPLQNVTPHRFEGHSGWSANTTVLAPGGQDVYQLISNKWGGTKQRYIDNFIEQMNNPNLDIAEAHAKLAESGFRNFYLQTIHPTASSDLPEVMINGQLQPNQCLDSFKKSDDPSTQHIILIAGKDASTKQMERMLRQQFPLIPPEQITVLSNPSKTQVKQSLAAMRNTISHQLGANRSTPQMLFYYQGHGGIFNKPDKHAAEGDYIGAVLLGKELADEKWFAEEIGKFPAEVSKTLIFDSCQAGSMIKV